MNTLPIFRSSGGTPEPRTGHGTRLTYSQLGYVYLAAGGGARFGHPFKPALGAGGVSFSRGLVEIYEPTIAGRKISTGVELRLEASVATKDGESWCCLEAVPNAAGRIDKESRLEMVHTDRPDSSDPSLARCAVALILWSGGSPLIGLEIIDFNLRYQRVKQTVGPVRHLFF